MWLGWGWDQGFDRGSKPVPQRARSNSFFLLSLSLAHTLLHSLASMPFFPSSCGYLHFLPEKNVVFLATWSPVQFQVQ